MALGHLVHLLVTLEHKQGEDKWHKLLEMEDDVVPDPISKLESATARGARRQPRLRRPQQPQQEERRQKEEDRNHVVIVSIVSLVEVSFQLTLQIADFSTSVM